MLRGPAPLLRVAALGVLAFHMVQLATLASVVTTKFALDGQLEAFAILPFAVAAFALAATATREVALGLTAAR